VSSTARSCGGKAFGRRSEEAHERGEDREAREEWRSSSTASESENFVSGICGSGEQFSPAWRHNRATDVGGNGEDVQGKTGGSRGGGWCSGRRGGRATWARFYAGENRPEEGEAPNGWGPPVRKKRKRKWKRKEGGGLRAAGLALASLGPRRGPVGVLLPFFCSYSFSIFC
jgi:hypothetical protein